MPGADLGVDRVDRDIAMLTALWAGGDHHAAAKVAHRERPDRVRVFAGSD
jgi:hypothetical protein